MTPSRPARTSFSSLPKQRTGHSSSSAPTRAALSSSCLPARSPCLLLATLFFQTLDALPYSTYINVGLEAADAVTLKGLRRPVSVESVRDAFSRMLDINRTYRAIEVTANFLFSDEFSEDHFASLLELMRNRLDPTRAKGRFTCRPLSTRHAVNDARRREIIRRFQEVKMHSLCGLSLSYSAIVNRGCDVKRKSHGATIIVPFCCWKTGSKRGILGSPLSLFLA